MTHPIVYQLRFTRSEWQRALEGITEDDARRRLLPMNCISWMVGHLAWHEHYYWLLRGQGINLLPDLHELVATGKPASTPRLGEMWDAWEQVTRAADPYLDRLTEEDLLTHMTVNGERHYQSIGTMVQRVIYHYWFHIGESQAVRQLLGHSGPPSFVGNLQGQAPYRSQ